MLRRLPQCLLLQHLVCLHHDRPWQWLLLPSLLLLPAVC
jgi:hypothetical protein